MSATALLLLAAAPQQYVALNVMEVVGSHLTAVREKRWHDAILALDDKVQVSTMGLAAEVNGRGRDAARTLYSRITDSGKKSFDEIHCKLGNTPQIAVCDLVMAGSSGQSARYVMTYDFDLSHITSVHLKNQSNG